MKLVGGKGKGRGREGEGKGSTCFASIVKSSSRQIVKSSRSLKDVGVLRRYLIVLN